MVCVSMCVRTYMCVCLCVEANGGYHVSSSIILCLVFKLSILCMHEACVCVCDACVREKECVLCVCLCHSLWGVGSEDNFQDLFFSVCLSCGPGIELTPPGLLSRHFYLPSHLASPILF